MKIPFVSGANTFWSAESWLHPGVCQDVSAVNTYPMPCPGKWSHLIVETDDAPGPGKSHTIAYHKNDVNTALAVTFGAADVRKSNLIDEASVIAGDRVGLHTLSVGAPSLTQLRHAAIFEPTTEGLVPFFGAGWADHGEAAIWISIGGNQANIPSTGGTEEQAQTVVPVPGKFKFLYGWLNDGAMAVGDTLTYTFRVNGIPSALALVWAAGERAKSEVVTEVAVVAGDVVCFQADATGLAHSQICHGICFIPDDPSLWFLARAFNSDVMTGGAVQYSVPNLGQLHTGDHWAAAEDWAPFPKGTVIDGVALRLSAAPGAGNSRTITVRQNGADTALALTISNLETFGIATGFIEPEDFDMFSVSEIRVGAAASKGTFSIFGTSAVVTVTVISPNQAERATTGLSVVITGTNFTGATVVSFGAGIVVDSFTVDSDTQITAKIDIAASAVPGTRDVSVTAPFGIGTLLSGFSVIAAGDSTPPSHPSVISHPSHRMYDEMRVPSTAMEEVLGISDLYGRLSNVRKVAVLGMSTSPVSGEVFVDRMSRGIGSPGIEIQVMVTPGDHQVSFGAVSGYTTPASMYVSLRDNEVRHVVGTYVKVEVPPEVGQELEVTTTPVSGEIFVDGVSKGWGSVVVTLSPGSHTVSFGPVSGYTTPAAQTVNV